MAETPAVLAVDLGAESGRLVLGELDGRRLSVSEIHRFPPTRLSGSRTGCTGTCSTCGARSQRGLARPSESPAGPAGRMGLDTWGVDFGLLDRPGRSSQPLPLPRRRTDGMMESRLPPRAPGRYLCLTGIQFMQLNTLYQLLAMAAAEAPAWTPPKPS